KNIQVNLQDKNKKTAFMYAIQLKHVSIIECFLDWNQAIRKTDGDNAGIDWNLQNDKGQSTYDLLKENFKDDEQLLKKVVL
ncbi:hypothetical protein RFI_32553, partial [Reticulomyxa filosa]